MGGTGVAAAEAGLRSDPQGTEAAGLGPARGVSAQSGPSKAPRCLPARVRKARNYDWVKPSTF